VVDQSSFILPPTSGAAADDDSNKASGSTTADSIKSALSTITKFIPAETITLFVAVAGIVSGWKTADKAANAQDPAFLTCFVVFLVLSPLYYVTSLIIAARTKGTPWFTTRDSRGD